MADSEVGTTGPELAASLNARKKYEAATAIDEATGLKKYPLRLKEVPRFSWDDPQADHLMTHEQPVLLLNTDIIAPAMKWTLSYLEENMGPNKHTVYIAKNRKFKFFDEKKPFPKEETERPMKKREWSFSKFAEEIRKRMSSDIEESVYYQDALTDTVGDKIKHDFVHFNWQWLNERKKRYNWGHLTSNLLLVGQPGNITPCHFDEQHNFFNQVCGEKRCILFAPDNFHRLYPYPVSHPCDRQSQVDFDEPDLDRFPNFLDVEGFECTVKAGDVLYIPMYWWHYFESIPKGKETVSITFWYKSGPVPNKIEYPLNGQQKTAIMRNIEKMLLEALKDPAEVGPMLHALLDGRY